MRTEAPAGAHGLPVNQRGAAAGAGAHVADHERTGARVPGGGPTCAPLQAEHQAGPIMVRLKVTQTHVRGASWRR